MGGLTVIILLLKMNTRNQCTRTMYCILHVYLKEMQCSVIMSKVLSLVNK